MVEEFQEPRLTATEVYTKKVAALKHRLRLKKLQEKRRSRAPGKE